MPQVTNVNLEVENPATSRELAELIKRHAARRESVMLWGDSGIGKTMLVHQIGDLISHRVIVFMTNIREPVDARGVPVPDLETGTTRWFVPAELPKSDGSDGPTILFVDEINTGSVQMMAVMMQLVLPPHCLGEYRLPDNCIIIAAGNRRRDSRAVQDMPKPLKNRFRHYTMIPDVDAWVDYSKRSGLAPEIVAFIRFRPECLYRQPEGDMNAYATPRSITACGAYVNEPPHLRLKMFTATVGKAVASEMESFVSLYQSLTNLDDVLKNPKTATVPTEPSEQYAVATAIARMATRQNFANVITYADRLPADIGVLCVTDAVDRDDKLTSVAAYGKWAVNNQHVTM